MFVMAKNLETVKTGWPIPVKVKESFTEFCGHVDSVAQSDCAGALFLWQHMPERIREWAKLEAKDSPAVGKEFWPGLRALIDASTQELRKTERVPKPAKSAKSG